MPKLKTSSVKQRYRLIAAVRTQRCLYDTKHPSYSNQESQDMVWNDVAMQCGIKSGQLAQLMWKKILDSYVGNRKTYHPSSSKIYSMFFKHLKFVDPYTNKVKRVDEETSFKEKTENDRNSPENLNGFNNMHNLSNIHNISNLNNNSNVLESTDNGEYATIQYWDDKDDTGLNLTELETHGNMTMNSRGGGAATAPDRNDTGGARSPSEYESYEDIILPGAFNSTNGPVDNSLKMFFDAMFASTVRFPQGLQRVVKAKIFSTVLEAEEEAENQRRIELAANCV